MQPARPRMLQIRDYVSRGWRVVPGPRGMKGSRTTGWRELDIAEEEVENYFGHGENVLLKLGDLSGGLVDVDLDHPIAVRLGPVFLPPTERRSGHASKPESHWWYRVQGVKTVSFRDRDGTMFAELRSTGALTGVPPSIHPSGETLEWSSAGEPADVDRRQLTLAVAALAAATLLAIHWPVKGSRESAAMAAAGYLLRGTLPDGGHLPLELVVQVVEEASRESGDDESRKRAAAVRDTWPKMEVGDPTTGGPTLEALVGASVITRLAQYFGFTTRPTPSPTRSLTSLLVSLGRQHELFRHDHEAFVRVSESERAVRVSSEAFKLWLRGELFRTTGRPAQRAALEEAVATLTALALEGPDRPVSIRVARHEDEVYIDTGRDSGGFVRVSADGWSVVTTTPVRFLGLPGLLPLPAPAPGGHLTDWVQFLNVPDERDRFLVLAWTVHALLPQGPYPVLVLTGEQGSGKTTTARMLQALIDPNVAGLRSLPSDERDLAIAAGGSWLLAWDNLSGISARASDAICRISTGAGFGTRKLYTGREEELFRYCRPQMLNGIDDLATRGDLADRALVVMLPAVRPGARQPEAKLWAAFAERSGRLFGALLDLLASVLRERPLVELERYPRMADFAVTGAAVARALGLDDEYFFEAYEANTASTSAVVFEAQPVARATVALMSSREEWAGTASDLLPLLNECAEKLHIDTHARNWPHGPAALGVMVRRAAPELRARGISFEDDRQQKKRHRILRLARRAEGGNHD